LHPLKIIIITKKENSCQITPLPSHNSHLSTKPLSFVPKVAVVERFTCNCTTDSENTIVFQALAK